MDWPRLSVLELLVLTNETGSLSSAAQACQIAQPNASRMITQAERRIGQPLLIRSSTGSTLTSTGQLIVSWAHPLLDAAHSFNEAVQALIDDRSHELRILASQTIAECYAPAWLASFHRNHTDVLVNMSVANSSVIMDMIGNTDERLGFVETPDVRNELMSVPIGYDQLIVICSPQHPWAKRKRPISVAHLATTPLVVREEGSGTRQMLERALVDYQPTAPAMTASSNAAVLGSVTAGVAPAVISARAAASSLETGNVVTVDIDVPRALRRTLHAVWSPNIALSKWSLALLEQIQTSCIDLSPR